MTEEKGLRRYVWPIMVILALVLMGMALYMMSMTTDIIDYTLEMSGSSSTVESLDEEAVAAFSFMTRGAFFSMVMFGIYGLFCAWGIKRKESFAWKLGVLWSVLVIANGIITATSELFVLGWSTICPVGPLNLIVGVIALGSLLAVRKEFF